MKIVVLDGFAANPGDLSWDGLKALGDVTVYERTPASLTVERAQGAEAIFTNKTLITKEVMEKLPDLQYVGVLATGYNVVDVNYAKEKGITVTNIPAYSTDSVAQMVFSLLLELCQHAQRHSDAVYNGDWTNSKDFCFWNFPLVELAGKTMGIIGFGGIGQKVAQIAYAFGMQVIAYNPRKKEYEHENFRWGALEEVFAEADVVSLHCPLFPETKGLVNEKTLSLMKKSAFIINTSRGPVIEEKDLADALNEGRIAGAGVDVLSTEPPQADNPLLSAKNCVITPHIAWASLEARTRLMKIATENLRAFQQGTPVNVVSK